MVCTSPPFLLLLAFSTTSYLFGILEGFPFSDRGRFCWGSSSRCTASTTLWNVDTDSSILLSSIWIMTVFWSHIPGPYCYSEQCYWLSLSIIQGNLRELSPLVAPPQSFLIMSWGTHGTVTHQLPSSLEKVCRPIPKYRMPVWMNINLPSFLGLRPHHHLYFLLI